MDGLLIRGGRLVDPAQGIDALRDLRISGGIVVEIGEHLVSESGETVIDASNAVVAPGFIDMHVHLREPGFPEKETIATGTHAAVRGGFTAVACMPNTNPALDTPAVLRALADEVARHGRCRVYPIAAITRGRAGAEPCDFEELLRAGAVAFSDDGNTVGDANVLYRAAVAARSVRAAFVSHCEDPALKAHGIMNEGSVSRALGVLGSPALAEDTIVGRDLLVAMETRKAWHLAHLTTAMGVDLLQFARSHGAIATAEVTPHHLLFTDEAVRRLGAGAKVNPPLRTEDDARALRQAVRDGTIDAFASDHAPHTQAEKSGNLDDAAVGFSGLEIAVGAYAAAFPDLPMLRFVELLSTNPARILGVSGGTLARGAPGDVTVFADRAWTVDPSSFASKGKSTPFAGSELPRCVVATVVGGDVRYGAAQREAATLPPNA
ncbi:MAG TPA: dihydroorotase [Candidatus Baltobacteraceae bacterium]|nr:dihydroorotase [Candidatus Baltobacteraceae bacterium]